MNPEIDIGKLALSIMEHPELIEKIKKLGENSNGIEAKADSLSEEEKNSFREEDLFAALQGALSEEAPQEEAQEDAVDTAQVILAVRRRCADDEKELLPIPLLMYDDHKPEDIDTKLEDHVADECRYMCMSNPIKPIKPIEKKVKIYDPLSTDDMKPSRYAKMLKL